MRVAKRSAEVARSLEEVWRWISASENWSVFSGAFRPDRRATGDTFASDAASGPKNGPLLAGAKILQKDPKGRTRQTWRITAWDPPNGFTLLCRREGFLSGFQAQLAVELRSVGDRRTQVQLSQYLMLRNGALELLSLLSPARAISGWGLRATLGRIRTALERV